MGDTLPAPAGGIAVEALPCAGPLGGARGRGIWVQPIRQSSWLEALSCHDCGRLLAAMTMPGAF